jgi:dTDP-4-dehydrorhamnose 3,5-epimerase
MIEGVAFKHLSTHADDRGFFRELIRQTDAIFAEGFGQLSHSLVHHGIVKAWHAHTRQTQWTYVVCGTLKVVLHDTRPESPTFHETIEFLVGDNQAETLYMFPPRVVHGYICVSGPAHVLYVTSGTYDLSEEVRMPYDDKSIGYDWTKATRIR